MDITSILSISVALAMDAFSISITKGFAIKNITKMEILWFGVFFGGFQALMPVLGYISGSQLKYLITNIAPWIAFILLVTIGFKMIYESIKKDDNEKLNNKFSFKELTLLAIATSIDAFVVGITFAILNIAILIPILLIGIISFIFSETGVLIGKKIGNLFGDKLEIVGGIVLIFLGIKTLIEGLGLY